MLELVDARGGYAGTPVLHGMALRVEAGEAVALLGRNGSGKTSTMKYLMGLLDRSAGAVRVDGNAVPHRPEARSLAGIGYVPQGRFVFPRLTVKENIAAAAAAHRRHIAEAIDDAFTLFPALAAKATALAGQLSGGQQQMLALGRALATGPKLILLDEPSEGVQPSIVDDMVGALREIGRRRGIALLVAEQDIDFALALAQRAYVIDRGQVAREMDGAALAADRAVLQQLLGV